MAGGALGRRGSGSSAMLVLLEAMAVLLLMSNGCGVEAGEEFTVGGDTGWRIPSDANFYADWAAQYQFVVGDSLKFLYDAAAHNVQPLVSEGSFESCNKAAAKSPPFHGGDTVITLSTPGTMWYICSVANHCKRAMKVKIDVSTTPSPTAAPSVVL